MKTFSVCILNRKGFWITNYGQFFSIEDINWEEVEKFVKEQNGIAYGYMYGHNSRNLVSNKKRTVLWTVENFKERLQKAKEDYEKKNEVIWAGEVAKNLRNFE